MRGVTGPGVVRWAFDNGFASAYCVKAIIVDGVERADVQRVEALESGEFVVDVAPPDGNGEVGTTPHAPATRRISSEP